MGLRRFEDLPPASPENVRALSEDHPAILQKTTMFETTVVNAADSASILVSGHNNRKIGKVVTKGSWKGMPIYMVTLTERATCPTACHMYRECYGNAMPFSRRHAPGEDFERCLVDEIAEKAQAHRQGFVVRLHVLGDFYSGAYVRLWKSLLAEHPQLHIYGYTAAGMDGSAQWREVTGEIEDMNDAYPEQCVIRWSDPEPIPGGATVISRLPEAPTVDEGTVCPAERDATACCATCGLCWEPAARNKTIVFVKHGMGSSKTESMATMASKTDSQKLRRVQPIASISQLAGTAANEPPTLMWVKPTELHVDETYQRNLSRKSIALISRIVQSWNWTHFKPPIVVKDEASNMFYVLDGQHTAIAAATHPAIDKIPIMVVDAEQVESRARAFIGHNRDRIAVTPLQLHHSSIVAQDAEAIEINAVCEASGVKVLRTSPPQGKFLPGETVALGAVRSLIRSKGSERAKLILTCLVRAGRAPVRADEMKALSILMGNQAISPVAIVNLLKAEGYEDLIREARDIAVSSALPLTEALAAVYGRRVSAMELESA